MALVHAELTATCNSLGCAGPENYRIDPQCAGIYLVINKCMYLYSKFSI